eukprot:5580795-Pyramimonas_sp.AAC.1
MHPLPPRHTHLRMTNTLQPGLLKRVLVRKEEGRGYMNVFTSLSRNDWVLELRRRKGLHGATVSGIHGIFGERHELALAANSEL